MNTGAVNQWEQTKMTSENEPDKNTDANQHYNWQRQVDAGNLIGQLVESIAQTSGYVTTLRETLMVQTGTRMVDWIDHLCFPADMMVDDKTIESALLSVGFELNHETDNGKWFQHNGGLFAPVCVSNESTRRLVIQVESVAAFLSANEIESEVIGVDGGQFRKALISDFRALECWVCERHGWTKWEPCESTQVDVAAAAEVLEAFTKRPRESFDDTLELIGDCVSKIGVDWACDLFFAAERDYWQSRNLAARVQKSRQDELGLGWGNHDHHTYRNSRENFAALIQCLEAMGFFCRERFYAGGQAGWGAQVLEQSNTGIVIFADVDLSPEELSGDFAHEGLEPQGTAGTVGLWCQLHGEAFLQAGMHHLECQFDFDEARLQLAEEGIESMEPFTNFEYLRQAFTVGEIWQVDADRIDAAQSKGDITAEQAADFRANGAVGSHLEILERNDGFKGFNQTGVSEIIRKTDPRHIDLES